MAWAVWRIYRTYNGWPFLPSRLAPFLDGVDDDDPAGAVDGQILRDELTEHAEPDDYGGLTEHQLGAPDSDLRRAGERRPYRFFVQDRVGNGEELVFSRDANTPNAAPSW